MGRCLCHRQMAGELGVGIMEAGTVVAEKPVSAGGLLSPPMRDDAVANDEAAMAHALATGLARLIEGQRRFGEEFGLPLSRVFSDDFEPFRGRSVEKVIYEWLLDGASSVAKLDRIFNDLLAHQMALLEAVDGAVMQALRRASQRRSRLQLWRDAFQSTFFRRREEPLRSDQTLRYLHLVAPAFIAAYAGARQQMAYPKPLSLINK